MAERRRATPPAGARVVPHDPQAEESLLGAMLLSRDAIAAAMETVAGPESFYVPAHGHVYEAIVTLYCAGDAVDPVTVADALRQAGLLEAIGDPAHLLALQAATPATSNAGHYARIVEGHAVRRRIIGAGIEIAEIGYVPGTETDTALAQAEEVVYAVGHRRLRGAAVTAADAMHGVLDGIEALYERDAAVTGVATGFVDLDEATTGFQPGQLIILGARPSAGKTSLALAIAVHAAVSCGVPVLMHSLEMSTEELLKRVLAMEGRIDFGRLRTGRLLEPEWPKLSHVVGRLAEAPLWIDDDPALSILELRAKARRHQARHGLGLLIVDYLQLMAGRERENRQVEMAEISRGLKVLARELNVPVLALSQLSRQVEMRADKRPVLSDLRDSGQIEQDGDLVMLLFRDEVYHPDSPDRGIAEVIIAKQRNGPTGTLKLAFLGQYAKFASMARGPGI